MEVNEILRIQSNRNENFKNHSYVINEFHLSVNGQNKKSLYYYIYGLFFSPDYLKALGSLQIKGQLGFQ